MDRRRRRAGALGFGLIALASAALAAEAGLPLRAMLWAPPDADPARAFATQPAECLSRPPDLAAATQVEIGRAAFHSPLLLGGQAARAGLSCESCHRGGRDNPDFQFPGVSGPPGTADVTHSLFSSRRGNGVHDPRPIPDLAGPRDRLKVRPDELRAFIRGLVVEEFDGPEPPPAVLAGLAAYVRALEPAACPTQARAPVTVKALMTDARRAATAALVTLQAGDRDTALVLLAAARARLGLINERFAGLPAEQRRLRAADARLGNIREQVRQASAEAAGDLHAWTGDSHSLQAALEAAEPRSLFDPQRLDAAAKRRLPGGAS